VTAKRQSKTQSSNSGVGDLVITFVLVAACFVLYHFVLLPKTALATPTGNTESYAGAARGIVVVDSKVILEAFTNQMQQKITSGASFTEGELTASGADFAAEYMRAVKKYRDAGYLVLDKRQALGVPRGSEITEEIGDSLSLDVVASPDIFSAPELVE